jgi:peptide/nickel transport system permease protein
MIRFLLRRLLLVVPALLGLLVLMFLLIRVVPSDPAAALAGDNATAAQIEEIRRSLGLDRPLHEQFWIYLQQVARGDFGISLYSGRPVAADIALRLPATIELIFMSLLFSVLVGIALGVAAAVWRNSVIDYLLRAVSMGGLALASFWVAIMLQLLFSLELEWLPLRGRLPAGLDPPTHVTGLFLVDSLLAGQPGMFVETLRHLLLPAFTLSLAGLASLARFTRSAMIENLQHDFVAYERAVGYPRHRIIMPYVLRNSLITPVTQIGLLFGGLISGAVAVEAIFDWPGVGFYLVQAILSSDYKAILAITLVIGIIYAFVNIVIDLVHGLIDPRVADHG